LRFAERRERASHATPWRAAHIASQADPNTILEAKAWLTATIAELGAVPAFTAHTCLLPALHGAGAASAAPTTTGLPPSAQRQLLQLLCEEAAPSVGQVLSSFPDLLRDFFHASDAAIRGWFDHFSSSGIQHFQHGAHALANYALTQRDSAWRHLVWAGKHPQAPVAVANKTHYFCELDVVATVRSFVGACPGFWESRELQQSMASGAFLALDYSFMIQVRVAY
jgi:hypothetical protein